VHPQNPDVAYVAAGGNEWSYNNNRGVYKTTDGGKSWIRILGNDEKTGAIDLVMDPTNPDLIIASTWNRIRRRWSDPVPEDGDYIYKTVDAGKTWSKLTNGLPETKYTGRVGLCFSKSKPNVVYIMGVPLAKSTDGGKTFNAMRATDKDSDAQHGDNHALWIDPTNSEYIINGNDGGVVLSYNGGAKWKNFFRKIPTTQFYNITYDMKQPYNIVGSVQDEGSFMGSIKNTYGKKPEGIMAWDDAPGGEGTIIAMDPKQSDIMYASSFYGRLMKSNLRMPKTAWGQKPHPDSIRTKDIFPKKADDEEVHRGEWLAFTMVSPHDNKTIYHGFQYLFESKDGGESWKRISDDLTYNDKSRMGRTPYAINHQAITAIDESHVEERFALRRD